MDELRSRRTFLRAAVAAGAAWAAADLMQVEEALAWSGRQVRSGGEDGLAVLTKVQAETVDALTSRILPSVDGRPGAHEAGVMYFIDRSLSTFNAGQKKLYAVGIADLNRRTARKWTGKTFAALAADQQDQLLRDIEKTPFFSAARFDTIVGTFALPSWGGNRDFSGWHLVGFEHQPSFQPPFGYYDADVNPGKPSV